MASHGGPNIVTDNLVLYLDAANTKSYSGNGTWNDISGKGHTATINGATYNSDKGGCFIFDGVDDYATIDDSIDFLFGTDSFTEEAWYKRGGNTTWEAPFSRFTHGFPSWGGLWQSSGDFWPLHYSEGTSPLYIHFGSGVTVGSDWVQHVTTTTNTGSSVTLKIYKNGMKVAPNHIPIPVSGWQPKGTSVGDSKISIGGIKDDSLWYDGKIAICRIYKGKALSAAEVKQNYDATKRRFGL